MNEETLFHEALARSERQERDRFLDEACAGRPELRAAVQALLVAHEQGSGFLDRPATPAAVDTVDSNLSTGQERPLNPLQPDAELPQNIGRYRILRLLGRGGMGAVYLAHDPALDREVALKVPRLASAGAEERFLREARAAAALSHPNLCPVYDAGRADCMLYLAMAYVPGQTLAQVLQQEGKLPPARAAAIATGVARGMAEAHRHGIVHRDLKPGNILFDRHGEPVVTDFGLARRESSQEVPDDLNATVDHDPRLTQAGALVGTPAYMSPEQARGDRDAIGPASDVYALGVILFEMLSGRVPFRGDSIGDTVQRILNDPLPPMPGAPKELEALCRQALARDAAARLPSMEAFGQGMTAFAAGRGRRLRRGVAVALLACVLILAAGVVFYIRTDHGTVEVRLSDPSADVKVSIDGRVITVAEGQRVTTLRAGDHALEVKGDGFQTETRLFKVTRRDKVVLEVELKPTDRKGPKPPTLTPDRGNLARLLVRGEQLVQNGQWRELDGVVRDALAIDPESPGALALRSVLRQQRGDAGGARADAETALKLNPETPQALLTLGRLCAAEGKADEAIAAETVFLRIRPADPRGWSNRASSYLQKKEYHQAIADATRAIELGFKGSGPLKTRGTGRALLGDYGRALADLDAAVKVADDDGGAYEQRALVHARRGAEDQAEADRKKAQELDPARKGRPRPALPAPPRPPERKQLTPQQASDLERALGAFERAWYQADVEGCRKTAAEACRIDPTSATARSAQSRIWAHDGRFREARGEATEAIRLDPTDAWAYSNRAVSHVGLGDPAAGIADATIALRLDPTNPMSWNNRAWGYLERGDLRQAIADATEAIRRRSNFELPYANRGVAYMRLGDYPKAEADYSKALQITPRKAAWLMARAAIRTRLNDLEGARKDVEQARKIDDMPAEVALPEPPPAVKKDPEPEGAGSDGRSRLAELLAQGRKLIDDDRDRDLGPLVKEALAIDPESPGALALRASYRLATGDRSGAREDMDASLRLNPDTFQALVLRAFLVGTDGKITEAIADLTVAIRVNPKHPAPWSSRSYGYLALKEYRQAVADATQSIELGFLGPAPYHNRAAAYVHLGEYRKALADLDVAAERSPNSADVFADRSTVQAKLGNDKAAAADWDRARALNNNLTERDRSVLPPVQKPPMRKQLSDEEQATLALALKNAETAFLERRYPEAERAVDEACKLDPTSPEARSLRSRILGQTGRFRECLAEANEAIRLDPTNAWAYSSRGSARNQAGDHSGAIADQTIAITLDAKHHSAWYNRGTSYARLGRYHQGLADAEESLRLRPGYAQALQTRAGCYLRLGEDEKALADYAKAAQAQPTNPQLARICAAICARLGRDDEARRYRETAIKIDRGLENAPEVTLPVPLPAVKKDPEN